MNGQPFAAIVNYACHPIIIGPDCDQVTPDYPGVVKRVVEQATGATCLFLQGATGDIGPIRGVARGGFDAYKRLGAMLGHEASRVRWQLELPPRHERYLGTLESGSPLAIYADEAASEPIRFVKVAIRPMHLPLKTMVPPQELGAQRDAHVAHLYALRADLSRQSQGRTHRIFELQAFALGQDIVPDIPTTDYFCPTDLPTHTVEVSTLIVAQHQLPHHAPRELLRITRSRLLSVSSLASVARGWHSFARRKAAIFCRKF